MAANPLYDIVGPGAFTPLSSAVDEFHPAAGTPVFGPNLPYGDPEWWTFPDYNWTPGPAGDYARWPFANDVRYAGDNVHYQWPGAFAFYRFRVIRGGFDAATTDHRTWVAICAQPLGGASAEVDLRKCAMPAFDPTLYGSFADAQLAGDVHYVRVIDLPVPSDSPLIPAFSGGAFPFPLRAYPRRPPDLFMVRINIALRFTAYSLESADIDDATDPTLAFTVFGPSCGDPFLTETVTLSHPGGVLPDDGGLMLRGSSSAYGYSTPDKLMSDYAGGLIDPGEALFRNDELGTLSINVGGQNHSVDTSSDTVIEVYPLWEAPILPDTVFLDLPPGTPTNVTAGAYDLGTLVSRRASGNVTAAGGVAGDSTPEDPAETPTKTATGDRKSGVIRR